MIRIRTVPAALMALDRPDDDFTRPEQQVSRDDVPAARSEPVESRSRAEYYEVLRAASDGEPTNGREAAYADRSGSTEAR